MRRTVPANAVEHLRAWRPETSTTELAAELGISLQYMCNLLNNQKPMTRRILLELYAADPDYWCGMLDE